MLKTFSKVLMFDSSRWESNFRNFKQDPYPKKKKEKEKVNPSLVGLE